jgi:hypothetical protein
MENPLGADLLAANTPCNGLSPFHDLNCGHRVRTPYPSECGTNCITPAPEERCGYGS